MVADHNTSERVYARLKTDLLDGAWDNSRLNINILADAYYASATPVREALLRLVGEGLVEMPVSGGFAMPQIDPVKAADHYGFSLALGQLVLQHLPAHPGGRGIMIGPSALAYPIDAVLMSLAVFVGNVALVQSVLSLNDRMHRLRRMEERRLKGLAPEIENVIEGVEQYNIKKIRSTLRSYHRRRQRSISKILGLGG